MDELLSDCVILRVEDQIECPAKICTLTRDLAKRGIDGKWWTLDNVPRISRRQEGDHHWQWYKIVGGVRDKLNWECVALMSSDDQVQGAMNYRLDTRSFLDGSLGSLFIDRLATAPWNRDWLVDPPQYLGVGTNLLLYAVYQSYSLGLHGRTTLLSLPNERTMHWYEKRGFRRAGDGDTGNYVGYELTPEAAQALLEKRGHLQ